jgi:peptidoglycan hydrolase-like protein with peptidoglycan-binding domain
VRSLDRGKEISVPRRRKPLRADRRVSELPRWRRALGWLMPARPLDALAIVAALGAAGAVLVNALALQPVPHPAPMFADAPKPAARPARPSSPTQAALRPALPSAPGGITAFAPVPAERPATATATVPLRDQLVMDLQRELAQRGYYDGAVDGLIGPRTQQAIRDFEQQNGLKPTGIPSEALLARVLQSRARSRGETTGAASPAAPQPTTQIFSVQRLLARLGYGPLKLTGLPDAATKSAIERFERDRGLAVSGTVNERLLRELAMVTGAPVE